MQVPTLLKAIFFFLMASILSSCVSTVDYMTGEGEAKRIRKSGKKAEAQILEIWDTRMTLNNDPIVGFKLLVRPVGEESYEAKTQGIISRLHIPRIQPGAVIPVSVDSADKTKIAIDLYKD